MILIVTPDAFEVADADVFTGLSVRTALAPEALGEAVEQQALGCIDAGGAHVWLDPGLLLAIGGRGGDARTEGVSRMLEFAASRGWIDGAGRIRAHVEQAPSPD